MDDYVRNKLNEWGLSECIERFEDEGIDKESLFCLHDQDIDNLISKIGPRTKFKRRLKLLKEEQNTTNLEAAECHQNAEEAADPAQNFARMSNIHVHPQVYLSTSDAKIEGKRKLDGEGSSSQWQSSPTKRRHDPIPRSYSDEIILADVKTIMRCVNKRIPNQDNKKLNKFLKDTINNLETDKRELVGVFGRTGAGKSSLINAVIGEKNLLPSGSVNACTSVMIKVEANMLNGKYEADIEFIAKEEWKDELWSLFNFLGNNADQEKDQEDEDYRDTNEKLSALYGEECKNINNENLFDNKYFKEIPEFLNSRKKTLTCDSAKELSARFVKYTRTDPNDSESKDVKKWYWPLVKCVTIRVPNNDLLKHVTLVDLPGNGDRNKSRDKMWKEVVGSCSTVWIVTDINRAVSEKEPWEVLESACSLMGNGGECKHIHFICTKSDLIEDSDAHSAAVPGLILKRNIQAKEAVKNEFGKSKKIKKHFSGESFQVFTVSSKEFLKEKRLKPDDTEIPKLQEFLQNLNDSHSEIKNYVSRAHGILSLIQGASCREAAAHEMDVCTVLEEKLRHELDEVRKPMEEAHEAFVKCLSEGVEKSRSSCETMLKSFLYPRGMKGGAFHRRLKCVVQNNGTHKPKKGKEVNLNVKLASCLTDSIDEEFRKTFPNEGKSTPFNGVINTFSLDTVRLIEKHKDVELQLIFLESEEEKIRTLLHKNIRECKKTIYSSLTTTIEKFMHECYEKAAQLRGKDSMKNMRSTIENHVHELKDIMFEQAKNKMLNMLSDLKESTLKKLEETMQESIDLSLKTDGDSIPAVKVELEEVKRYCKQLKGIPDEVIEIC